ncbi:MAG TPA: glycine zipper domain-containing protein [Verrucomicrobiae bacterium]|nr:glycine zipper domain-containing protein [Verrucomicrobiae bacterium]
MKLRSTLMAGVAAVLILTGCRNPDGSSDRAGTGALAGAGAGAITGARYGGGGGALIGAAAGAITGGIIGHILDERHQEKLQQDAPQTYTRVDQNQPLTVADVKALAKTGVSDDVIINQIRNSRTVYRLSSADIIDLHQSGISETVINYMINTPSTASASVTAPLVPPAPVVVSAPPPAPPVQTVVISPGSDYVWVGGEWVWSGRWVWAPGHWGYPPYPHAVWVVGSWNRGPRGWYRAPGYWR